MNFSPLVCFQEPPELCQSCDLEGKNQRVQWSKQIRDVQATIRGTKSIWKSLLSVSKRNAEVIWVKHIHLMNWLLPAENLPLWLVDLGQFRNYSRTRRVPRNRVVWMTDLDFQSGRYAGNGICHACFRALTVSYPKVWSHFLKRSCPSFKSF